MVIPTYTNCLFASNPFLFQIIEFIFLFVLLPTFHREELGVIQSMFCIKLRYGAPEVIRSGSRMREALGTTSTADA